MSGKVSERRVPGVGAKVKGPRAGICLLVREQPGQAEQRDLERVVGRR